MSNAKTPFQRFIRDLMRKNTKRQTNYRRPSRHWHIHTKHGKLRAPKW